MNCEIYRQISSEYLDGQLKLDQRQSMAEHLDLCGGCHEHLEELRSVSLLLGGLTPAKPHNNLPLEILAATEQRETVPWNVGTMFSHKIAPFRPRLSAHLSGLAFSVVCFSFILSQFASWPFWERPIDLNPQFYVSHADFDRLNPSRFETHGAGPFTLPEMRDLKHLEYVNTQLQALGKGDEIVFLARIDRDGKVTFVQLMEPSDDPRIKSDIMDALAKTSFVPAREGKRPVESQTVLMMYWVNIKG